MLFVAPHRAMFLSGAVMLLVSFAMWALELGARVGLMPAIGWVLPPAWMHALLVTSGVFPFFMFGFLLTAMPRWQGYDEIASGRWLWAWRLLAAGWGLTVAGMLVPGIAIPGLLLVLVGWGGLQRILWQVAHHGELEALHARLVCYAMIAGMAAVLAWLGFAASGNPIWARVAIEIAVFCSLLPVFFSVCHRMVPFFSSGVIPAYVMVRPLWVMVLVVGGSALHAVLDIAGLQSLRWVVDVPAAFAALWLSRQWRLVPALKVPLLGMLHIGFLWLGIALTLFSIQDVASLLGYAVLGLAPLHAIGVGFFGSVLLAMVSRVTLGHSGRKLAADRLTWGLFLGLELVVVIRVLAEVVPAGWSGSVMLLAVLGWLGVFGAWATRYLPIYWRPRSDGRPG
ncbi:NnrS family protein [Aromatoleum toluvorans]|uniref:NnrS family protein n=1 Tax=Aromatoleum toluvorans TaxID=92002 RepID=A0ABX1Q620_9RHOO|nr:NnrS family protein [Aromatoleum toluvorans]NMG45816.1 NnrS family protein [Aromatoleum toluvorans]